MAISCLPKDLLAAAKCYDCLTAKQRLMVIVYLLCQWANASGGTPSTPLTITIDPASVAGNTIVKWTQGVAPTTNEVDSAKNGGAFALLASVAGATTQKSDPVAFANHDFWCYEVRACNGASCSAFTAQACAANGFLGLAPVNFPTLIVDYATVNLVNALVVGAVNLSGLIKVATSINANGNNAITSMLLTALKTVGNAIDFTNVGPLVSFSAPALLTVGAQISFNGCTSLTTLTLAALQSVGNFIDMTNASALTSWSTPALTSIGSDWVWTGGTAITSVSAPALTTIGGSLVFQNNTNLTTVTLTNLNSIAGQLNLINTKLATFSLPALTTILGAGLNLINGNNSLTTLNLPLLSSVGDELDCFNNPLLSSVTLTALSTTGGNIDFGGNGSLVTLNFPSLTSMGLSYFGAGRASPNAGVESASLANVTLPNMIFQDGMNVDFGFCSLTATSCQNVVRRCVLSPGLTGATTIDLSNGANASKATWNAQGQADYNTLIGQGVNILVNP